MANQVKCTFDLFVSYADADRAWVEGYLLDALNAAGVRCHSEAAFALGVPRLLEFERAVRESQRTLLVLSPAYLAEGFNQFTDLLAQSYGLETATWPVVPLLLQPVALPSRLAMLTALDATNPANWPPVVERLCAELQRPVPGPAPKPPCPYPGMVPFRADDARFFYGREEEIEELWRRLRRQRYLWIIGPSGSGKSSLVFAGLLPKLHERQPDHWLVCTMRPGNHPVAALQSTLGDLVPLPTSNLHSPSSILQPLTPNLQLLLIVDQCEELFAQASKEEQAAFIAAVRALRAAERCTLLLALRADFYPELMTSDLWPVQPVERVEIAPLRGSALRDAIALPAERQGVYLEAGLLERLLADAAEEPGVLPLVQETMVLLWERMTRRLLPLSAYERLGGAGRSGLAVAVATRADAALAELSPGQQTIARRVFLRLVQFGEGRSDTRRQQPVAALRAASDDPETFEQTLEHLTRSRLLTLSGAEGGEGRRVDIAHEALIAGWPTLQTWLAPWRGAEQTQRRLEAKAAEWERLGRGSGGLLDQVELAEAERWLASPDAADLGYREALPALVEASRTAQEQAKARQRRTVRFRLAALGAIGALIIAVLSVGLWSARRDAAKEHQLAQQRQEAAATAQAYAINQQDLAADAEAAKREAVAAQESAERQAREARRALSRQLAMQAQDAIQGFPQRGLLLAVEALNITSEGGDLPIAAAREALWQGLANPTIGRVLASHGGAITAVALSQDDHWLAAGGEDNTAYLWNLATSDQFMTLTILSGHSGCIRAVAISPDSHWLVTGSDDRTARLWDLYSAHQVSSSVVLSQSAPVDRIVISPDSRWLVTVSENEANLWDLTASDPAATPINLADYAVVVATFSNDSHWLATGGGGYLEPDEESGGRSYSWGSYAGAGQAIQLWDLTTGNPVTASFVLSGHVEAVYVAAFSSNNHWLATGSWDKTARLWDLTATNPATHSIVLSGHEDAISAIAVSSDSHWLVTGSIDATARLWDLTASDPAATARVLPGHDEWVSAIAISPDSRWLVTSGVWDNAVRLWDLTALDPAAGLQVMQGPTDWILNVSFSPNGNWLGAHSRDTIALWDFSTGDSVIADPSILRANEKGLNSVVSLNSTWLATGSEDGAVRLWDLTDTDQAVLPIVLPASGWEKAITISPDNHWLVTHMSWRDIVRVWNLADLKAQPTILTDSEDVVTSADNRWLVTSSQDCATCVWGLEYTDSPTYSIAVPSERIIAASTDNHWLVIGNEEQPARLWDLTASEPAAAATALPGYAGGISAASISPDNRWLVTQKGNTFRLWDLRAEDPAAEFIQLPHGDVGSYSIAFTFSPDTAISLKSSGEFEIIGVNWGHEHPDDPRTS